MPPTPVTIPFNNCPVPNARPEAAFLGLYYFRLGLELAVIKAGPLLIADSNFLSP